MELSEELMLKLERSLQLLGEVQLAVLREDEQRPKEQRNEEWRRLYKIRVDLSEEINWWKKRGEEHYRAANHIIEAGEEG